MQTNTLTKLKNIYLKTYFYFFNRKIWFNLFYRFKVWFNWKYLTTFIGLSSQIIFKRFLHCWCKIFYFYYTEKKMVTSFYVFWLFFYRFILLNIQFTLLCYSLLNVSNEFYFSYFVLITWIYFLLILTTIFITSNVFIICLFLILFNLVSTYNNCKIFIFNIYSFVFCKQFSKFN